MTTDSVAVVVGKFNDDDLPDVAFANTNGPNTIYLSQASKPLSSGETSGLASSEQTTNEQRSKLVKPFAAAIELGNENSLDVALIDANNDGLHDLVFANSVASMSVSNPANTLYINDGGTFDLSMTLGSVNTISINVNDFNGDTQSDLMFINSHGGHQFYLANNANGYDLSSEAITRNAVSKVASADLDNDGNIDIVFADNGSADASVLLNQGDATFSAPNADIAVSLVSDSSTVIQTGQFSVQVTLTNNGPQDAPLTELNLTFDSAATLMSGLESCTANALSASCLLGTVQSNDTRIFDLVFSVAESGSLNFSASALSALTDNSNDNNTATEVIDFAINQAPTATNDSASTQVDIALTVNVKTNDSDDQDISQSIVTIVADSTNGTTAITDAGAVTYTPNTGFTGSDTFTYQLTDALGEVSEIATVSITVRTANTTTPPSSGGGGGGSFGLLIILLVWARFRKFVVR
jgi:hypothetical protein